MSKRCGLLSLVCALSLPLLAPAESAAKPAPAAKAEAEAEAEPKAAESPESKILNSLKWTVGPGKAAIGKQAQIEIPEGTRLTDGNGTRKMLEMMHNPTGSHELGLLTNDQLDWFVIFEFEDIGYVKDADKEKLDGNAILESLREGNEIANEERTKRGWPAITIVGWHTAPFYNKETNNLEWCIKGQSQGRDLVNYNTRILGRGGVMSANLLVDPEALDATLPQVKTILRGFSYVEGHKYSQWKTGDKIAKYGLSALVMGGAVGVAAKLGLFGKIAASLGKLWKAIILGLIGVGAALKALIFGKKKNKAPPSDGGGGLPRE